MLIFPNTTTNYQPLFKTRSEVIKNAHTLRKDFDLSWGEALRVSWRFYSPHKKLGSCQITGSK